MSVVELRNLINKLTVHTVLGSVSLLMSVWWKYIIDRIMPSFIISKISQEVPTLRTVNIAQ